MWENEDEDEYEPTWGGLQSLQLANEPVQVVGELGAVIPVPSN